MATATINPSVTKGVEVDELLLEYKGVVSAFCYFLAQLSRLKNNCENAAALDKEVVTFVAENIRFYKSKLESIKEELGLPDGLSFLENNRFDGFEIKDGSFIGDTATVEMITRPWYDGMTDRESNCYLFEVANYINALAFPDMLDSKPEIIKALKLEVVSEEVVEVEEVVLPKENYLSRLKKGGSLLWQKTKQFTTKFSWLVPVEPADIF